MNEGLQEAHTASNKKHVVDMSYGSATLVLFG